MPTGIYKRSLPPPEERIWRHIDQSGDCWLWTANKKQPTTVERPNYGLFGLFIAGKSKTVLAHRWLYQYVYGQLSSNMTLDHLCRIRNCVNPTHLEPVTAKENVLRGYGVAAVNARKKFCVRGHSLNADNIYTRGGTRRICKECTRLYKIIYRKEFD